MSQLINSASISINNGKTRVWEWQKKKKKLIEIHPLHISFIYPSIITSLNNSIRSSRPVSKKNTLVPFFLLRKSVFVAATQRENPLPRASIGTTGRIKKKKRTLFSAVFLFSMGEKRVHGSTRHDLQWVFSNDIYLRGSTLLRWTFFLAVCLCFLTESFDVEFILFLLKFKLASCMNFRYFIKKRMKKYNSRQFS